MSPKKQNMVAWQLVSPVFVVVLWLFLKESIGISDRYLPHPRDVFVVLATNFNDIWYHFLLSLGRAVSTFLASVVIGISIAGLMFRAKTLHHLLMPIIQSVRAVPATAALPFFILWFGFSEQGRIFVIVLSISTNISVAAYQIYQNLPEKYLLAYQSYGISTGKIHWKDLWYFALESLLPTLRFSLTVLMGVSVVAELLGAQTGLGYLIQAARTSYALDVLLACVILFGVITATLDKLLRVLWSKMIPWKTDLLLGE